MFDDRDELVEGTRSNVFVHHRGAWLTPVLGEAGIAGILRELVLELAPAAGITVREACVPRTLLAEVEEIFVCNSLAGIWPVRELAATPPRRFACWPATTRLVDALRAGGALP
jgi:4-amino-4-deoxychorismate lyase